MPSKTINTGLWSPQSLSAAGARVINDGRRVSPPSRIKHVAIAEMKRKQRQVTIDPPGWTHITRLPGSNPGFGRVKSDDLF
jgi:hypothetical protein